ncbi:MAG: glucose-1-phosphate adenylyltransferase subunit GlgD [Clostridiales Family XIII bacterium]|jgi:glucose-1-phosphate adenylyltransferase|nr:glucose-1-phosphate adenylyltransferase subunit GlgD [Clostridiales Family XIII bacterium]
MIRDAFGLIYAGEQVMQMRELVEFRAVGAVPIGGRYRVIDFPLSNFMNSGIRTVGIIANRNYNSLMDHLSSGKAWDLSRKDDGLFFLTPFANKETGAYKNIIEALRGSMDFIRRAKAEYCILTNSHMIYNSTYDDMMRFHVDSGADITMLYNKASLESYRGERFKDVRLKIDKTGRITDLVTAPESTNLDTAGMETLILRKDILIYLTEECAARGETSFAHDFIRGNLDRLKMMGFEYTGYVGRMHSVAAYYRANMDLIDPHLQKTMFQGQNRIYTKVKDEVPAKYIGDSRVKNSLVANGCIIEGEVENSMLFRGAYIGKGVTIKNCILLPNTEVNDNSELEYVILDKNVGVRSRTRLIGNEEFPVVIRKGARV